jgi:hypothetical protein
MPRSDRTDTTQSMRFAVVRGVLALLVVILGVSIGSTGALIAAAASAVLIVVLAVEQVGARRRRAR